MKNSINMSFLPLSNAFIERYITSAKSVFVCIYIYSLKKCIDGKRLTLFETAQDFDILESDVLNAWKFWKKEGVVDFKKDNDEFFVEFFDLNLERKSLEESDKKNFHDSEKVLKNYFEPIVENENKTVIENKNKPIVKLKKETPIPNYSVDEINLYKENDDVKKLFKVAEKAFSSMLDFNKMKLVFGFYDWLGMSIDVIEYLIKYCVSNGKGRNLRYIESVALDWCEREIDSVEKAEELVKTFNNDYREIMKSLGIPGITPVEGHIVFMKDWLEKLPLDIIKVACEKTVMTTGKPSLNYANSIIQKWYKRGVKTISDIKKIDSEFNEKKSEKKTEVNKSNLKKHNKFINYEQRSWDFDTLNKLKGELLDKNLKE